MIDGVCDSCSVLDVSEGVVLEVPGLKPYGGNGFDSYRLDVVLTLAGAGSGSCEVITGGSASAVFELDGT